MWESWVLECSCDTDGRRSYREAVFLHLEHAETGRDTRSKGLSEKLDRGMISQTCIDAVFSNYCSVEIRRAEEELSPESRARRTCLRDLDLGSGVLYGLPLGSL